MKALLDTNIIIHRENTRVTNQSIGLLFYWLDKLHYDKMIHPLSIKELRKFENNDMQEIYDAKLTSYFEIKTIAFQSDDFKNALKETPRSENDEIDNQLLCEVYTGRVDILITEDRRMLNKAIALGISDKVFSINSFIEKATSENPELINYSFLSVKKTFIGDVDISNIFFDSLRESYYGFDEWFSRKSNEEAYICYSDNDRILGFLYIKTEEKDADYHDIIPVFEPKRRLKIGTFKVDSTGFRLGERFIKIIFDNAIERNVDEIYLTLFDNRSELKALGELLKRWGFFDYGIKNTKSGTEKVLVKKLKKYDSSLSIKENFPNVNYNVSKWILPIYSCYHTNLLPDSHLKKENEVDFIGDIAHRYALQKVYVTWGMKDDVKKGDIVIFYRIGDTHPKAYSSFLTTVAIIDEYITSFTNQKDYMNYCENRSVFSKEQLEEFWRQHKYNLCVMKFIYVKNLEKKVNLQYLWDHNIVSYPEGPRPFTRIQNEHFNMIINASNTKLY